MGYHLFRGGERYLDSLNRLAGETFWRSQTVHVVDGRLCRGLWACGVSSSLNMLIFFRVVQGVVAGPLIPLSQSLLLNNYPPAKRSIALALWSMTVIVAPICGPILGATSVIITTGDGFSSSTCRLASPSS